MFRGWWALFGVVFVPLLGIGIDFYVHYDGTATISTIDRRVEYVDNRQNY